MFENFAGTEHSGWPVFGLWRSLIGSLRVVQIVPDISDRTTTENSRSTAALRELVEIIDTAKLAELLTTMGTLMKLHDPSAKSECRKEGEISNMYRSEARAFPKSSFTAQNYAKLNHRMT